MKSSVTVTNFIFHDTEVTWYINTTEVTQTKPWEMNIQAAKMCYHSTCQMWWLGRAISSCHPSLHTMSRDFQLCLCASVSQITVEPTSAIMRWLISHCWEGQTWLMMHYAFSSLPSHYMECHRIIRNLLFLESVSRAHFFKLLAVLTLHECSATEVHNTHMWHAYTIIILYIIMIMASTTATTITTITTTTTTAITIIITTTTTIQSHQNHTYTQRLIHYLISYLHTSLVRSYPVRKCKKHTSDSHGSQTEC